MGIPVGRRGLQRVPVSISFGYGLRQLLQQRVRIGAPVDMAALRARLTYSRNRRVSFGYGLLQLLIEHGSDAYLGPILLAPFVSFGYKRSHDPFVVGPRHLAGHADTARR
jgi:hypothetical protein